MISSVEHRICPDRRDRDMGPPQGMFDRRSYTERRLPEVREEIISDAEWETYFGKGLRRSRDVSAIHGELMDILRELDDDKPARQ